MTRIFIFTLVLSLFIGCQPDSSQNASSNSDMSATQTPSNETKVVDGITITKAMEDPSQVPPPPGLSERLLKGKENNSQIQQIVHRLENTMSSNMLESVDFKDGQVRLKYFKDADSFNLASGNRKALNNKFFKNYWSAGARAQKVISQIPAELLKDFDFVNSVKVSLPIGNEVLKTQINREALSKLTGYSWSELKSDWTKLYINNIVRIPEGREKFMKELVK